MTDIEQKALALVMDWQPMLNVDPCQTGPYSTGFDRNKVYEFRLGQDGPTFVDRAANFHPWFNVAGLWWKPLTPPTSDEVVWKAGYDAGANRTVDLVAAVTQLREANAQIESENERLKVALGFIRTAIKNARDRVPDEDEGLAANLFAHFLNRADDEARAVLTAGEKVLRHSLIESQAARIAVLEGALRVYAGPTISSHSADQRTYPHWADGYPGGVFVDDNILDFGEAAREALEPKPC